MEWINVKDRLPPNGGIVLVFRPQVITEDHTDKPIREAAYIEMNGRFDCYHQPTMWAEIKEPEGFTEEMRKRQRRA